MRRLLTKGPLLAAAVCLSALAAGAQEPVSFHKQVRPVLAKRCQMCHAAKGGQGGVIVTTVAALRKGGDAGPAVIPGQPGDSLLIHVISGLKPAMPKAGPPLTAQEVELIRQWIAEGARDDSPAGTAEDGVWWSLKPLASPPVPRAGDGWARTPVDRFIAAKLAEKGLAPSPEADRRMLIRRLTYNLHGLPPTPEEISAYVNDPSPDAYEKLVDRLLDSPRYGERWGRHWLDVVHYGESHGFDKDKPRRNAWPYRDYVIRSLNSDKPYRRFLEEQLAGDALHPDDPEGIVATGFIAAGPWDFVGHVELREGTLDKNITRNLDRDDMVMTAISTFASMTVHCARCHDHKFDPIPQADYYNLQAVFAGVDRADRPFDTDLETHRKRRAILEERRQAKLAMQPVLEARGRLSSPEIETLDERIKQMTFDAGLLFKNFNEEPDAERRRSMEERHAALRNELAALNKQRESLVDALMPPAMQEELAAKQAALKAVEERLATLPEPQWVYAAATDFNPQARFTPPLKPRSVYLLGRGSVESPLEQSRPAALSAVSVLPARFDLSDLDNEGARRAALARWLADDRNPLTWRSIVNRVWHYHFGRGIVDTPNDFGRMGSEPTHPELLDWLAVWFRDQGGSLKKLHRLILTSAVYRQGSAERPEFARIDAGNQFLWRMNRARLEAEAVRDSVLYLSGRLDPAMGGPSAEQFFFKDDHSPVYDYARFDVDNPANYRRGIYRFLVRSVPDPFMESLDCADPSLLTPKRNTTLTAVQALALLNDPLIVKQSEYLAERLRHWDTAPERQIGRLYQLAFGRDPSAEERRLLAQYADRHGLANAARMILNTNEFLFVD